MPETDPDKLLAEAETAAAVRGHQSNPDVIAYNVARMRDTLDRAMWSGIVLGLLWTASSVQQWIADGAAPWSQTWMTAWLTTAPVEIPLVVILLGEQYAARHGITPGSWVRGARHGLLAIMLTLNVWGPLADLLTGVEGASVGLLAVHLFVPLAIVLASEAITSLRAALGEAIDAAARTAAARGGKRRADRERDRERQAPPPPPPDPPNETVGGAATKREIGIAWALQHWPHGTNSPAPAAIRAGLLAEGINVSSGEASKIRAAAVARRADTDGDTGGDTDSSEDREGTG